MPKVPEVSPEAWKDLYAAAAEFAALEPWELFDDSEVFAIRDPQTGQTGYACVLGSLGEIYALCVYRGAEGFDVHRRMQRREFDMESGEIIGVQNCLMAEFADREELEKGDRDVIKKLGLKFRGSKQWPMFRSHLPDFAPWHLDEAEAKLLTLALRCGKEVAQQVEDSDLDLADRPGRVLCYSPAKDGSKGSFVAAWEAEPIYERPQVTPLVLDSGRLAAIQEKKLKPARVWEADAYYFPGILQDRERPYFPRHALIADAESGMIVHAVLSGPENTVPQCVADALLEAVEKSGSLPREVHVRGAETARLLEPLAVGLGIKIEAQDHLEAVSEAMDGLEDYLAGGQPRTQPGRRWDHRAMERSTFNLSRRLHDQEFESPRDADRYLKELQESGELNDTPAPRSALEVAQNLMYDAFEHDSPRIRMKLARRALKISPDCADAYNLLAEETAGSLDEERQLYQKALEAGERALGREFFTEHTGHFWGMLESRPYMRARAELARCLWELGDREAAIGHWREMLWLNPNDNQGMRHVLLARLGGLGRFDEMKDLFVRYKDDGSLEFLLVRALATFVRQGPSLEAAADLREAFEQNRHFGDYLLGKKRLPRYLPESLQLGGESEAVYAVSEALPAWERVAGALDWAATQLSKFALPKVGRNESCPCGSRKKFKKCCGQVVA